MGVNARWIRKVQHVRDSYLIILPKAWAATNNIQHGMYLQISLRPDGKLTIEKKEEADNDRTG